MLARPKLQVVRNGTAARCVQEQRWGRADERTAVVGMIAAWRELNQLLGCHLPQLIILTRTLRTHGCRQQGGSSSGSPEQTHASAEDPEDRTELPAPAPAC